MAKEIAVDEDCDNYIFVVDDDGDEKDAWLLVTFSCAQ